MKVKHIISACGILLGGIVAVRSASAVVTYKSSAEVQFTFSSTLSLSLAEATQGGGTNFVISDLAPGNSKLSNQVNVVVSTDNVTGYTMGASVGNSTDYNSTDLALGSDDAFSMISSGSSLSAGEWGYTLNGTAATPTYSNLPLYSTTPKTLVTTSAPTASGGDVTPMWIGAYADASQLSGTYLNVINFTATANVVTYAVTVVAGDHVTLVTPATTGSYAENSSVAITATCESGYTFNNWTNSTDYGTFTDASSASTNFVVGKNNTTVTAYCK